MFTCSWIFIYLNKHEERLEKNGRNYLPKLSGEKWIFPKWSLMKSGQGSRIVKTNSSSFSVHCKLTYSNWKFLMGVCLAQIRQASWQNVRSGGSRHPLVKVDQGAGRWWKEMVIRNRNTFENQSSFFVSFVDRCSLLVVFTITVPILLFHLPET